MSKQFKEDFLVTKPEADVAKILNRKLTEVSVTNDVILL